MKCMDSLDPPAVEYIVTEENQEKIYRYLNASGNPYRSVTLQSVFDQNAVVHNKALIMGKVQYTNRIVSTEKTKTSATSLASSNPVFLNSDTIPIGFESGSITITPFLIEAKTPSIFSMNGLKTMMGASGKPYYLFFNIGNIDLIVGGSKGVVMS